ncbi:MAG TPA: hypothetical protein PLX71_07210 [Phycicoccus sp.]|nr:hypothetical protein [Phycicoccus sp.]
MIPAAPSPPTARGVARVGVGPFGPAPALATGRPAPIGAFATPGPAVLGVLTLGLWAFAGPLRSTHVPASLRGIQPPAIATV